MKRCPECRRDYYDDSLQYCLDDGTRLLDGPSSRDEPATAILSTSDADETKLLATKDPLVHSDARKSASKRSSVILAALILLLLLSVIGFAIYRYGFASTIAVEHFKEVNLTRVTAEGGVETATISADGKYIAYTLEESGKRSLWTKHLASESRIQIVPPVEAISMYASAFSPDGGYVYYTRQDEQNPKGALYAVPVLGGTPRKILADVSQPVSVSRDGKQILFGRYKVTNTDDLLMIANSDGTKERLVATVSEPEYLQGSAAAWSPDGSMIAVSFGSEVANEAGTPVYKMNVAIVPLSDPKFKPLTSGNWPNIGSVAWLNDGSGLVFIAGERRSGAKQIWLSSYPSGESRRITNDLNSYDFDSLSVTADDSAMIAVQKHPTSQIWVAPDGDTARARAVVTRKNVQDGHYGLGWTPDGRIVYDSIASGNSSIWIVDPNGAGAKQLTDGSTDDFSPEVSPDGRYILFGGVRNSFQIWRMGIDGGDPRQMTQGTGTPTFSISPDGRWIISNPYLGGIFKTPADGGEPIEVIAGGPLVYPQVSPDGDLLAYLVSDKDTKRPRIVVTRFESALPVKTFDLPVSTGTSYFESLSYRGFHWSPDGKSIVYIDTIGGVSNLWRQPLEGGPPRQITDFKADKIYTFAYSHDGKTLAFARGSDTPDAVLITNLK